MPLEKLGALPKNQELSASLHLREFIIPPLTPAPMLARSAAVKKAIAVNPSAKNYNGSVGEPPVDKEILENIATMLLRPEHDRVLPLPNVSTLSIANELQVWVREFVSNKMTLYCPKPGDPQLRKRFMTENGNGFFSESEHIILTGGMNVVEDNITALLNLSRTDQTQPIKGIKLEKIEDFDDVIRQIDEAQAAGKYISFTVHDSATTLTEKQKEFITEKAKSGKMIIVDLVSDKFDREKSLGAIQGAGDTVVTVLASPMAEITGVYGVFCNETMAKFMLERNTNIKGTPSSEMYFMLKLMEFADPVKRDELFSLDENDIIDNLVMPEHDYLKNLIRLLQYSAFYVYEDEVSATERKWGKEVFQEHVSAQLQALDEQTKKLLVDMKLMTSDGTVVWDNGGARGRLDDQIEFIEKTYDSHDIIIFTPCWSYIDLIKNNRNMVWTPAFTKKGFQIDVVLAMFEKYQGRNAMVIIPGGSHNPTGFIISGEEMEILSRAAEKYRIHVIFDPTYAFYMDEKTAAKTAVPDQLITPDGQIVAATTFSASKNFLYPSGRMAAGISNNSAMTKHHQTSPSRTNHEVNPLATLTLAAMTQNPERLMPIVQKVRNLTEKRRKIFRIIADSRNGEHGNHTSGYYEWITSPALIAKGPQVLDELVQHRIGQLDFVEDLKADPAEWGGTVRSVLYHDPKAPDSTFKSNVIYLFDQTDALANEN